MKKNFYSIVVLMFVATQAFAQCGQRYKDFVFPNVTKTSNVTYSTSNGTTLKLDVYEPTGDTQAMRPLIILAHGGSFIGGSKSTDPSVNTLCNNFAKRGYVTASIDYRLGFFLDMLDSAKAIEVVLKAISDGKSAVRFFRKDAATTNTYRIDPDKIFAGGNSAGSVLYMHVIYLDSTNEAPANLRAIINANGGFEGNSGNPGYPSEVNALINCAGGLNVPEFVGPGSKPSVNFHGDADDVVPYGCGLAQGGTTPVRLCGLEVIEPLYQQYSVNHVSVVFPGDGHVPWDGNTAKFTRVDTTTRDFLYNLVCGTTTSINDVAKESDVQIYPNPATDMLRITFKDISDYRAIQLIDVTGQMIHEEAVTSAAINLARNQQPSGVYFVRLVSKDGSAVVRKVVFE